MNDEEKRLELAVLGGNSDFLSKLQPRQSSDEEEDDDEAPEEVSAKPVWVDQDDLKDVRLGSAKRLAHLKRAGGDYLDAEEFEKRRRHELERTRGAGATPAWASVKPSKKTFVDSDEEEEAVISAELLRSAGGWLSKSAYLPQTALSFKRLRDPNFGHRLGQPIPSLHFHPSSTRLMLASQAQKMQLFRLGKDEEWELERSVALESFRLSGAAFAGPDTVALVSSNTPTFVKLTVSTGATQKLHIQGKGKSGRTIRAQGFAATSDGKYLAFLCENGEVKLVSGSGHGWLCDLKHNGIVLAAASAKGDPGTLYIVGDEGVVYVWDLATFRCVHKFRDEGCLKGTALAVSDDSRFIAVGSSSGIVNVYARSVAVKSAEPKPMFTLGQLTTLLDSLVFSPSSELLLFASSRKPDAARLAHVRSGRVFDNWPGRRPKLGAVRCAAFSASSAFLALGGDKGQVALFRLHHYQLPDPAS